MCQQAPFDVSPTLRDFYRGTTITIRGNSLYCYGCSKNCVTAYQRPLQENYHTLVPCGSLAPHESALRFHYLGYIIQGLDSEKYLNGSQLQ